MRALLDLMRENENGALVQDYLVSRQCLLRQASKHLQILDPELGDEELIKSMAAELAKVTALIAGSSERQ